MIHMQKQ